MFKMPYISINIKLNIMVAVTSLVILSLGVIVLFYQTQKISDSLYQETKTILIDKAKNEIASKMSVGITNAVSLSNDPRITQALETNNQKLAIEAIEEISSRMKKYTNFKDTKIHLHTKDNFSFLRSWKRDQSGDNLSNFRPAVVRVNQKLKPILTFEAGRAGLLLRAIIPIVNQENKHIGSLEFIQSINSVVKVFNKKSEGFLLLMDKKLNAKMKKDKNFYFNQNKQFQKYIISQQSINPVFLEDAKNINLKELFQNGYALGKKYFYTYSTVRDFQQKSLGIMLLGKPLFNVNNAIEEANKVIYLAIFLILGMILITNIIIIFSIQKLVIRPLKKFELGLLNFFHFLQEEKEDAQGIDIKTHDEFGVMASSLNKSILISIDLHKEIKELNFDLEQKVEEKNKKVKELLNNAGQGFLSFSDSFKIEEEYSNECIKFLGKNIKNQEITPLLFKDKKQRKFFKQTILEVFTLKNLPTKNAMISLLPSEILLNRRILKLEYRLLENKKIMLIISNISSEKKLKNKIKEKQEVLKMIVEIVSDSDLFFDIKKEYEQFIYKYNEYIELDKTSLHNINNIYRIIHTFKGSFSQLYMTQSADNLHQLESEISILIKENRHSNNLLKALLKNYDLTSSFSNELHNIEETLGEEFLHSKNFIQIQSSEIRKLKSNMFKLLSTKDFVSEETQEILSQIKSLGSPKLIKLLKPYKHAIEQLALRLNKELYEVQIIGDYDILVHESFKPLIKSFIHIFRNSIDHGIELPEARLLKGKDEIGTISCSFKEDKTNIEIIIADDGAGLDKEIIIKKAVENNIISKEESLTLTEDAIYDLIFKEQFSTKENVSNISGRGIGMSAVEHEVKKLKGTILINTEKDRGTSFIFNLPKGL